MDSDAGTRSASGGYVMSMPQRTPGAEKRGGRSVRIGCALFFSAVLSVCSAQGASAQQTSDTGSPAIQANPAQPPSASGAASQPADARPTAPTRAARLTYVGAGVVLVDRGDGSGTEPAQQNMPLAQGTRLTSTSNGEAEIEFEDGSIVRLTPNSAVNLDYLGTSASGNATRLNVLHGLVYCELRAAKTARFMVQAGEDSFWPLENTTVRVNLDDPPAVFSVLDGRILVQHIAKPAGSGAAQVTDGFRTPVHAGESLRGDTSDPSRYFLAESIPPESWDNWNEGLDQRAADQIADQTPVRDGYAGAQGYGWSDLDANGTWYNQPDAGPVWQPDEALEADFDPYGYGSWTYFGNVGYTWASGYPWGWTPYRCGQWNYWNGFGWGWQPNNFCQTYWNFGGGFFNIGRGPRGYVPIHRPVRRPIPPHPIVPGSHAGERPPAARSVAQRHDPVARQIAGVIAEPIHPAGFSYTPRGGTAVGSGLRRDYAVDAKTQTPVLGVPSNPVYGLLSVSPGGDPSGWRAFSSQGEIPAERPGFFRSIFHGSQSGTGVRLDPHGNPYLPPSAAGARSEMRQPTVSQPQGFARPQSVPNSGYRPSSAPPPAFHPQPSFQPAPQSHSSPAPAAAGGRK